MTFVTLKKGQSHEVQTWSSTCPGASLYQLWWGHLEYFSRYRAQTIFHVSLFWMTFVTLKIRSRSPSLNLLFCLPLVLWSTKFNETLSNISPEVERKLAILNELEWPLWPWKEGQGHEVQSWSSPCPGASVYQIRWGYVKYFFRYWEENHLSYAVTLNDLCDLENKMCYK